MSKLTAIDKEYIDYLVDNKDTERYNLLMSMLADVVNKTTKTNKTKKTPRADARRVKIDKWHDECMEYTTQEEASTAGFKPIRDYNNWHWAKSASKLATCELIDKFPMDVHQVFARIEGTNNAFVDLYINVNTSHWKKFIKKHTA